jgi:hypothetical protein
VVVIARGPAIVDEILNQDEGLAAVHCDKVVTL